MWKPPNNQLYRREVSRLELLPLVRYRAAGETETMNIASVGSAFPKHYYPQKFLSAALKKYWNGRLNNPEVVDRMQAHVGIDGRFLALPVDAYYEMTTWGQANDAWIECA